MINGQMKEAVEGRVRLNEVDQDTFIRFIEYLYGNDYNPAKPLVVIDHHDDNALCDSGSPGSPAPIVEEAASTYSPPAEPVALADNDWALGLTPKHKKHKKHTRKSRKQNYTLPLENFKEFVLPHFEPMPFPRFESAQNDADLMYDYSEILSHVRLYGFAEKYQIKNLQALILGKLHMALEQTSFHPRRTDEFLLILKLAYDNTPDLREPEPLRNLLTLFGAWNFPDLIASLGFLELIHHQQDCVMHLCQKVARRL